MQHKFIGKCSFCKKMIKRTKRKNFYIFETPVKDIKDKKISFIIHTKPSFLVPFVEWIFRECNLEITRVQQMVDLFLKK